MPKLRNKNPGTRVSYFLYLKGNLLLMTTNRREWLKLSSLAVLGSGFSLRSLANEEGILRNFGAEKGLINLGSNENPYGISPKARQAIIDMLGEANRYAFNIASLQSFKKELAAYYKVLPEQVLITAGSGEALALLARHYNKGNLVTAAPTFAILPNTAKKIGTEVIEIALTADKVHDLPKMLAAITDKTQLVYICNPANPTTTVLKPAALKSFCEEARKKATVVIDEAYIDFLDAPYNESMIELVGNSPNIIVLRTFSKIHAMAGLRVGFLIAHPSVIKQLEPNYFQNSQFAVSNLALTAAQASLTDEEHRKQCKQKNEAVRTYTFQSLQQLGIRCIPSYTNFMFFYLNNYAGDFAQDMLTKNNVMLRSSVQPDGKWARVSMGTMDEMKKFITIMQQTNWKS
jgi:histidinol-phosphate aminotransferase